MQQLQQLGQRSLVIGQDAQLSETNNAESVPSGDMAAFMQYIVENGITLSSETTTMPSLTELTTSGGMEQVSNDLNVGATEMVLEAMEQTDKQHHPLHLECNAVDQDS